MPDTLRNRRRLAAAALLAAGGLLPALGGCAGRAPRSVNVYAAASLTDAFRALALEFERADPRWRVRLQFAASSLLRTQIEQGAPADVFAPADWAQMRPLEQAGRAREPRPFARTGLTIVVPESNPGGLRAPFDLARPGLRLVTAAPSVPIGRYTGRLLERLGALPGAPRGFAARVRANVVSREANVRAALARVELGEADAAVVYESDVRAARAVRAIPVPEAAAVTAEYPIAVVAGAPNPEAGAAFVRFVLSPAGRAVLRRHGFR